MEEFQISSPLVWSESETDHILIGKILASKSYTRSVMEAILSKAWNLQSGFVITKITGNAFIFKFMNEEDYNRVLRGRPWSVNGSLLNLLERSKYKSYDEFDFSRCPIWIQMHNIPLEALCLENAVTIGGHVGKVILAEDPHYNGRYLRNFLHARVVLDLRKPLSYGFWLPRPDGRKVWTSIKYEKLQTFCYNCGKIRHDNRTCHSEKLMSSFNMNEPRFGAWLSTSVCRNWDETLAVIDSEEAEALYVKRKKDEAARRTSKEGIREAHRGPSVEEEDLFSIQIIKSGPDAQKKNLGEGRGDNGDHSSASKSVEEAVVQNYGSLDSPDVVNSDLVPDSIHMADKGDSMALVLYHGGVMKEVINVLSSLGLKRNAVEDWECGKPKRRKCNVVVTSPLTEISRFANNLKKTKAKARRGDRKKRMEAKENIPTDGEPQDKEMEESDEFGFVFRARSGKRSMESAVGVGGWPETATKAS
ncbi:hypothetical protein K1719_013591 [Acacia pycnantha]|nr:hypothetical protein K1719_013591 [Acacia pycnantha]